MLCPVQMLQPVSCMHSESTEWCYVHSTRIFRRVSIIAINLKTNKTPEAFKKHCAHFEHDSCSLQIISPFNQVLKTIHIIWFKRKILEWLQRKFHVEALQGRVGAELGSSFKMASDCELLHPILSSPPPFLLTPVTLSFPLFFLQYWRTPAWLRKERERD